MARTKSQLIGNVSTGASIAGIITASGFSANSLNVGISTIGNITISSGIITSSSGIITYYGNGGNLTGISAGSTVFIDNSTNGSFYPVLAGITSGVLTSARVSTTGLTYNPSSSTFTIGTGITLSGSSGNISIAGTISAAGLNIPIRVSSFDPAIGSTSVGFSSNIIINFNQTVGFGTTGFVEIKSISSTGPLIERLGIGSARAVLDNGGRRLTIDPTNSFGISTSIHIVMSNGFVVANGNNFTGINTVGTAQTYFFSTPTLNLGNSYEGGILICAAGGVRWVISPSSSQVSVSWYCRNDAVTCSQSLSGCTGWFVPTCGQLQNPGYTCRTYWDSFSNDLYWTNTEINAACAFSIFFFPGGPPYGGNAYTTIKTCIRPTRAFRCVTY